ELRGSRLMVLGRGLTENDVRRFIEVTAGTSPPPAMDDTVRFDVLFGLASALHGAGEPGRAKETFSRAVEIARALGAERLGEAAYGFSLGLETGQVDQESIAVLSEALDALGEADSGIRSRLLTRLSSKI